jgi:hypothetical protein
MIQPDFLNPEQRNELVQIVRRPSEDHGVARRANAILLLDDGLGAVRLMRTSLCKDSVTVPYAAPS